MLWSQSHIWSRSWNKMFLLFTTDISNTEYLIKWLMYPLFERVWMYRNTNRYMPWNWNEKSCDITSEANKKIQFWLVYIINLILSFPMFINNISYSFLNSFTYDSLGLLPFKNLFLLFFENQLGKKSEKCPWNHLLGKFRDSLHSPWMCILLSWFLYIWKLSA